MGFQRFDEGTKPEVIGRAKFVLLADEIHHKIYRFMICLKSKFFILANKIQI